MLWPSSWTPASTTPASTRRRCPRRARLPAHGRARLDRRGDRRQRRDGGKRGRRPRHAALTSRRSPSMSRGARRRCRGPGARRRPSGIRRRCRSVEPGRGPMPWPSRSTVDAPGRGRPGLTVLAVEGPVELASCEASAAASRCVHLRAGVPESGQAAEGDGRPFSERRGSAGSGLIDGRRGRLAPES